MGDKSTIEWTEATWNPTTGCTKISPGCANCYAATLSKRLKAMGVYKYRNEFRFMEQPNDLELPLKWKNTKKIFVNSMSDLFHENARIEFIARCFSIMLKAHWHTYQVLTKRPQKMRVFSDLFEKSTGEKIPSHIWMGVSVENDDYTWRINELRKVKSQIKFISFEPLIGSVGELNLEGIDWAIIGGESGHNFRPVQKEWIMEIIEQCKKQKVAVFFKQWGGIRPKSGGREINGKTYSDYPEFVKSDLSKLANFETDFYELYLKQIAKKELEPIRAK
ncbi:DUF5131 family protein [Candidatus Nitrosotenuis uzonensis]|uniref:Gp37Gp68 family protein n=1 Tax=Candidatus Nitrosotenuis uzonensis TaxID=1407055 RepID=A0A812EYC4_9ARCH|nr:phage Gp37/Gp68 family protein [Candidatus Nitrosotenuis uzonensis]CAE6488062.1 Gp37Gp68 family protein [Candidatus Nitrosotenuis uzonensis]